MKAACTVTIEFTDAKTAKKVLQSVRIDDLKFVQSRVHGKTLEADMQSTSVSSLLHTLDDYLACVSVADSIVKKW